MVAESLAMEPVKLYRSLVQLYIGVPVSPMCQSLPCFSRVGTDHVERSSRTAPANSIQPTIKQVPPTGTIAPSILMPERTSAYKQPLKMMTPTSKSFADQVSRVSQCTAAPANPATHNSKSLRRWPINPLLDRVLEPVCPKRSQRHAESAENTSSPENMPSFHVAPKNCLNIKKARRAGNGQ